MALEDPDQNEAASLDLRRARKFFKLLAEDPFIAVVVTDGEVRVFSKDLEPDHLDRIKHVLTEIQEEREDGKEG